MLCKKGHLFCYSQVQMKYFLLTSNRENDPVERSPINNELEPETEAGVSRF